MIFLLRNKNNKFNARSELHKLNNVEKNQFIF